MSPRPRLFLEGVTIAELAEMYRNGLSTRDLQAEFGVSRWVVSRLIEQSGAALRDRDSAMALNSMIRTDAAERERAASCRWPGCSATPVEDRLCVDCAAATADVGGRGCPWPRCPEQRAWDGPTGDWAWGCVFHVAKAAGLLESGL